jgi:Ca2+-binding EF-hand superfamily protein
MKKLWTFVCFGWIVFLASGCHNSQPSSSKIDGVTKSEEEGFQPSERERTAGPLPAPEHSEIAMEESPKTPPRSLSEEGKEGQESELAGRKPEAESIPTRIPIGWVDLGSPERLDLLLTIDGMPIDRYRAMVEEEVGAWFDAELLVPLTWTKALEHPFGTLVQSWLIVTAGVARDVAPDQATLMERYDENENGLAEPKELVRWMSRGLVRDTPVLLQHANASARTQRQNSQVFRILDLNSDATIDAKEADKAIASLSVLDANGDRVIDPSDLMFLRDSVVAVDRQRDRSLPSDWYLLENMNARRDFLELLQGSDWNVMCERSAVWKSLLSLYEAWEEMPDRKSVSALAQAVVDQPADLHLELNVANRWIGEQAKDVADATNQAVDSLVTWSGASRWRISGPTVGQTDQSLLLMEFRDSLTGNRQEELVQRLANRLGVSKDVSIEVEAVADESLRPRNPNEFMDVPSPRFFDLDRDGKVAWGELQLAVRRMTIVASSQFSLRIVEIPDLAMVLLDRNGDDRVSEREIDESPGFLKEYADSLGIGDSGITGDHLPLHRRLILERRSPLEDSAGMMVSPAYSDGASRNFVSDGWFAAMDSNRDGVVSPREFLGPSESWKQLDLDGDGWIESEEAEEGK